MKKSIKKNEPLPHLDSTKAGIDIGAKSVFVCISNDKGEQEVREYPCFTRDIQEMGEWLLSNGVKSIAMESTGIYWQPLFEILAPMGFELILCNPTHFKNVPGRKTDVKDAQWLQQLHSAGLLSGSFRPSDDIIPLRIYARKKRDLSNQASRQINLMHKILRQMNIQLDIVLSRTASKTGLAIIKAIIDGERNPAVLASLREKNVRCTEEEVEKALQGNWREEYIFELTLAYNTYQYFNAQIALCEKKINEVLSMIKENVPQIVSVSPKISSQKGIEQIAKQKKPAKRAPKESGVSFSSVELLISKAKVDLTAIPGISEAIFMMLIAEFGLNMDKFPTVKHFVSWLGLCPSNKISGNRVLSSKTKPSSNRAAYAFRLAAFSLFRSDTYLGGFFRKQRAKLGTPKAITATAHKIARIVYVMLKYGISYQEHGANYYEENHKKRVLNGLGKKAAALGYQLTPVTINAPTA